MIRNYVLKYVKFTKYILSFFAFFTIIIYKNTLKILPAIVAMPCALRS